MSEARLFTLRLPSFEDRLSAGTVCEFGLDELLPAAAHPKVMRLVALWQSMQPGPGRLPGRKDFDPLQARDLLNNLWLIDVVEDDLRRYRLRLVGGALSEAGSRIRKGHFFGDTGTQDEAARIGALLRRLEASRRANWRRGPAARGYMEHVRDLERVILPMASDGATVDLFMCLTVFYYPDGGEA